jgi:spore maturation protein CgeB
MGIEVELFLASDIPVSYFHKVFFKRLSRWAWSLRLKKKGQALFLNHPKRWENIAADGLYHCYEKFKPDLLFFIHEPSYGGFGEIILEKILAPKIGWYVEPFVDMPRLKDNSRFFDIYNIFHSDAANQLAQELVKTAYLCHAANPKSFYPLPESKPVYDLCFVGNFSPWRDEVLKAALGVSKNIALYGPNWLKKGNSKIGKNDLESIYKGEKIVGEELNRLFNSSKIVLSASRIRNSSGLNMRFFEVLAAGACFITDAPIELELHFIKDKHLVIFDSLEELSEKLENLLKDPVMRKNISQAGHEQVVANHTYAHTAKTIISQYNSLKM